MKKIFTKMMLLAVAATALASCAIDDTNDVATLPGVEVSINATTTDVSRSAFGEFNGTTYPTLWEGNEDWFIAVNDKYVEAVSDITFSDDLKSANVNFTLQATPTADSEGKYTLRALSPASAWSSYKLADDYMRFYIARNTQNPTATSCDPASQVLFAKSEAVESANSFNVSFEHLSAYCNFSFLNVAEGGVVKSVTISSEDVNLAGRYEYTPSTGALKEYDRMEKSITLTTDLTENLWFALAPVDVSGKKLTFTIITDKGALTRDVPMPEVAKFESGKVVTFSIDMAGIEYPSAEEGETWYLVTDVADITDGEYFIVAKNNSDNIVYLPSTTNTSSAPSQKAINVTGLDLSSTDEFTTTLIPEDARFTFSGSASEMTITNAEGKYLYTTAANNGLRVGTTEGTWSFNQHASDAKALSMKFASTSRYIALYNSQDWRSYTSSFGRYVGNNTTQNGVTYLYKKFSTDPAIVASNIEVSAEGGDGEATYSVKNMTDDVTASTTTEWISNVSVSPGTITYTVAANYTGAVRSGEIVLTSTGAGVSKTITVSQAADVFEVSATEISLGADAEATAKFTVNSTYAFTLTNPAADKLSLSATSGEGTVEITVTALTANTLTESLSLGNIVVTRTADNKIENVAVEQKAASTGGGDVVASWKKESWSKFTTTSTSYGSHTINGDLGTWTCVGCSAYENTNTQVVKETGYKYVTLGDSDTEKAKVTSPTFATGIQGLKFKYYANNTARPVKVTIYENGAESKTQTITPSVKSTLLSAEVTVTTTGSTYITFESTSTSRRVSIGEIEILY